jgi:hypothetical protein
MDSLKGVLADMQGFLYGGILSLPLVIGGTMLILGLFTANYAMLFFLVGFLVIAPLGAGMLDIILQLLPTSWIEVMRSDVCRVVQPFTTLQNPTGKQEASTTVITPWLAMTTFFLGYMGANASQLYTRPAPTDPNLTMDPSAAPDKRTTTRTSQAMLAMASVVLLTVVVLWFRYKIGCESAVGLLLTTAAGGSAGYGWYQMLSVVGQDRLSDLFGIANRLMPPSAFRNGPVACMLDTA